MSNHSCSAHCSLTFWNLLWKRRKIRRATLNVTFSPPFKNFLCLIYAGDSADTGYQAGWKKFPCFDCPGRHSSKQEERGSKSKTMTFFVMSGIYQKSCSQRKLIFQKWKLQLIAYHFQQTRPQLRSQLQEIFCFLYEQKRKLLLMPTVQLRYMTNVQSHPFFSLVSCNGHPSPKSHDHVSSPARDGQSD